MALALDEQGLEGDHGEGDGEGEHGADDDGGTGPQPPPGFDDPQRRPGRARVPDGGAAPGPARRGRGGAEARHGGRGGAAIGAARRGLRSCRPPAQLLDDAEAGALGPRVRGELGRRRRLRDAADEPHGRLDVVGQGQARAAASTPPVAWWRNRSFTMRSSPEW